MDNKVPKQLRHQRFVTELSRYCKKKKGMTHQQLASYIRKPLSTVQNWFSPCRKTTPHEKTLEFVINRCKLDRAYIYADSPLEKGYSWDSLHTQFLKVMEKEPDKAEAFVGQIAVFLLSYTSKMELPGQLLISAVDKTQWHLTFYLPGSTGHGLQLDISALGLYLTLYTSNGSCAFPEIQGLLSDIIVQDLVDFLRAAFHSGQRRKKEKTPEEFNRESFNLLSKTS